MLITISVIVAVISWYLVKRLIMILSNQQMLDIPNERTLHQGAIPRGAGLVIVLLLALAVLMVGVVSGRTAMFAAIFISLSAWGGLSWLDDRADLSPRYRLMMHFVFALLSVAAFGAVQVIQLNNETSISLPLLGVFMSVLGVVWFANLYNFMDGLDGLAASQTIVAGATLSFWFWQYGDQGLAIICLVLAAASYGFLFWNWHPAKVFMGDVGSVTIGAFFATMLLIGVSRYDLPVISFVVLLGVFIADASVTILQRLYRREKIWLPHRSHYYQRLANSGISHIKILIAMIILMSISSLIASTILIYRDTIVFGVMLELILLVGCAITVEYIESRHNENVEP